MSNSATFYAGGFQMATQSVMTHQQMVELAAEWDAAWAARDLDRLVALYTSDAVWDDPSLNAPVRGAVELREFFAGIMAAIPDVNIQQEVVFAEDGATQCATQWRATGTVTGSLPNSSFAPTGDHGDYTGVAVISVRDGKCSHVRQYPDVISLQRQIGALPPQGSRGERMLMRLQAMSARRRMKRNKQVIRLP
jgi:steroid delta-isomerase-like uncharacterized protein